MYHHPKQLEAVFVHCFNVFKKCDFIKFLKVTLDPDTQVTWKKYDRIDLDSPGHPAWLQC